MSAYSLRKRVRIFFGKHIIKLVIRFLWWSCRVQPVIGEEHIERLRQENKVAIICYWHQMHIFGGYYMLKLSRRGLKIGFLVSPSSDGEIAAQIIRAQGLQVIRGSASKTGARALRDMYEIIHKQRICPVITPDGPRGPAEEFQPGTIMLAQLTKVPIVPMAYAADKAWYFKSWDRFMLPKPFARIQIAVGAPVEVGIKLTENEKEQLRQDIAKTIIALALQARENLQPGEMSN
jgi:lysophospholipid acyltransferase (LPLAT)-like uncharacterized protein